MKTLRAFTSFFTNLYFLLFVTGFLFAAYITCSLQNDYENNVFVSLSNQISGNTAGNTPRDTLIKKALHTTWYLLHSRSDIFKNTATSGFLDNVIHPLSSDLMTAQGSCGSYASILCRILNTMGIETRFAQMKVNGLYGGHIIIEAFTQHGWVVLDPFYNVQFLNPHGQTVGFAEVAKNWQWYKKQVPLTYDLQYRYEGVRYTNWNKIPVIMPAMKQVLSVFMRPAELEHLSIRNYFLRKYQVCENILLLIIIPFCLAIMYRLIPYKLNNRNNWRLFLHHLPVSLNNPQVNT
jgi:hypothetical protein